MKIPYLLPRFNYHASSWPGLVFAAVAGGLFVFSTFGRDFILGTSPYWQSQVDDVTQYIAGFNVYFSAPWEFPLLAFNGLNYPHGTRVTFVDAIPLYALFLKLVLPASYAPFNPFGAWVAISFVLQAIGAWWITRALRVDSWFFLIALLTLVLTFPALMARIGHISLMSHWILLFSLALYIRSYQRRNLQVFSWTLLLAISFYINIYLFVMASGILLATLFSLNRPITSRDILRFLFPFFFISATAFFFLFPLSVSGVGRESGFGFYSMNLLAPFSGGRVFALQVAEVPGQYEGFNYLGLGVLVGMFGASLLAPQKTLQLFKRHRALFVLLLLYTLYALSNHVYFGGQKILVLSYPSFLDGLTSQFRASGRFFWPVGYTLAVLMLFLLYRRMTVTSFSVIALLIAGLQITDLRDRHRILRATVMQEHAQPLDFSLWDAQVGDNVKVLYFYPKFRCGANPLETLLPVMRYAAYRGLKLNTGYIARYVPDCDDVRREIAQSDFAHSAFIFSRIEYPYPEGIVDLFPETIKIRCSAVQFSYVCVHESAENLDGKSP